MKKLVKKIKYKYYNELFKHNFISESDWALKSQKYNTDTSKIYKEYLSYIEQIAQEDTKYYKKINCLPISKSLNIPKLIAFYLPQFHQIKENDEWWEKGFTEWTNVTKTYPCFVGHHQPFLPMDLGFYDLKNPAIMVRQVELAKLYGISGFCFHYYWFSGQKLMEYPVYDFLNRPELDIEFCFNWANEDFVHNWNGGDGHVLLGADVVEADAEKFFNDILPFFKDKRYIKINNRPLLMIYKPQMENKKQVILFMRKLRELAKNAGYNDMYLLCITGMNNAVKASDYELDGAVEFPPHEMGNIKSITHTYNYVSPKFKGDVLDMADFIKEKKYLYNVKQNLFRCCFPSWDNTSRKAQVSAAVFQNETPDLYKQWLKDLIIWTKENKPKEEQYVFINAWNEWAEGACLEPTKRYGYAYLQATKESLEECYLNSINNVDIISLGQNCVVRSILSRYGIIAKKETGYKSSPFDLAITPLSALIHFIKTDFVDYFDNIYYDEKEKMFANSKYGCLYPYDSDVKTKEEFIEKYSRRIKHFRELLKKKNKLYFVHSTDFKGFGNTASYFPNIPYDWFEENNEKIMKLTEIFEELNLDFKIILVDTLEAFTKFDNKKINTIKMQLPKVECYAENWYKKEFFASKSGIDFESNIALNIKKIIHCDEKEKNTNDNICI